MYYSSFYNDFTTDFSANQLCLS